jgi:PQQ-dependent catabolism-associated CXXCW motif protein
MIRRLAAAGIILTLLTGQAAPPEPAGYRMTDYRAPTPLTLAGARALTTEEARDLWRSHQAVFVDVLPQPPRPANLPAGTIWNPKPREDIPGSIWLPDTGYGALAPAMQTYFLDGLQLATSKDRNRTLIFYCLADCWQSWNAAKRALALGYTHVDWYRDGTDGWQRAGLPLESRQPVPRPDVSQASLPAGTKH